AVALLDRIGPLRYAETLRAAGVPLALPAGAEASLPLALGGGGISLRDAATLYTALAGDGSATRLRLLAAEPVMRRPFLEARAARTIAGPLTTPFPDGGPPGVAWKTGTSWGGRDAWALGFDAAHVAGVWVGRPDGTPLPGATGTALALPILAHLFDLLPPAPRPEPTIEQEAAAAPAAADALRLLFPPDAATLSADGPVTLRAMGGRRPLAFLVDGVRVPAEPVRRTAEWSPPGPGFYRLTVLDADGAAAHAGVRIK
ncbi:MAG: penicillin-binding protein 1C, partial [Acidisphaera sp.]|nr:penicillin-binding protein 1C [Acidisphaera sp.]